MKLTPEQFAKWIHETDSYFEVSDRPFEELSQEEKDALLEEANYYLSTTKDSDHGWPNHIIFRIEHPELQTIPVKNWPQEFLDQI